MSNDAVAESSVPVTIGNQVYRLRFTIRSIREVQRLTSKTFNSLVVGASMIDVDAITYLLQAALLHEHRSMSPNAAADLLQRWVDEGTPLDDVVRALDEATIASKLFRRVEEGEGDERAGDGKEDPPMGTP